MSIPIESEIPMNVRTGLASSTTSKSPFHETRYPSCVVKCNVIGPPTAWPLPSSPSMYEADSPVWIVTGLSPLVTDQPPGLESTLG